MSSCLMYTWILQDDNSKQALSRYGYSMHYYLHMHMYPFYLKMAHVMNRLQACASVRVHSHLSMYLHLKLNKYHCLYSFVHYLFIIYHGSVTPLCEIASHQQEVGHASYVMFILTAGEINKTLLREKKISANRKEPFR